MYDLGVGCCYTIEDVGGGRRIRKEQRTNAVTKVKRQSNTVKPLGLIQLQLTSLDNISARIKKKKARQFIIR